MTNGPSAEKIGPITTDPRAKCTMTCSKLQALFVIGMLLQMAVSLNTFGDTNHGSSLSPYENALGGVTQQNQKWRPAAAKMTETSGNADCDDCFSWDIDGSGKAEPLTDGLIVLRYLFGFSDEALISGALANNASRTSSEALTSFLKTHEAELDIDGDDRSEPLTDGLLLLRYLFGFDGFALTDGATSSAATRATPSSIEGFILAHLPETQNDPTATPELAWDFAPAPASKVGTTQTAVDRVIDHIFTDIAVQAALVTKDGYLIGERFSPGYDADSLGTSWSVAKSFYSAAIGAAIGEGLISSVNLKASEIITEWQGTAKADVTLHNMLQMRSGYSSIDDVFFSTDQTAYSIDRPRIRVPGARFAYSNANSQLFEPILKRTTGLSAHDYLSLKILEPIGINLNDVGLWLDATGDNPMTYCCIDMKPTDFARFGLLYARGGQWRGTQIVPTDYVTSSLTANGWYGYQWWIMNSAYFSGESVPIEVSAAQGLDGQYIFIWPEEDVVVVVLSQYSHPVEQGYVLDLTSVPPNYPVTCTARNSCPGTLEASVQSFGHLELVERMAALGDSL